MCSQIGREGAFELLQAVHFPAKFSIADVSRYFARIVKIVHFANSKFVVLCSRQLKSKCKQCKGSTEICTDLAVY